MNTFAPDEKVGFLADLEIIDDKPEHIANKIGTLTVDILDAWKLIYNAFATSNSQISNSYRKDMTILLQVRNMLQPENATVLTRLGGRQGLTQIIQNRDGHRVPCYTYNGGDTELPKMNTYLRDVAFFANRYGGLQTATNVLGGQGITSNSEWQVRAAAHMIRFIWDDNQSPNPTFVPTAFELSYTNPNPFPNCRVDAQIGIDPNKIVCEFKSWGTRANELNDEKDVDDPGKYTTAISSFENFAFGYSSFGQFRCYLQQISAIDKLRYYFDINRSEVSETYVKGIFQKLIYDNATNKLTPNGELVFDAIWGNTRGLKGNLFPDITNFSAPDAKDKGIASFILRVKNTSNSFYNFINVK